MPKVKEWKFDGSYNQWVISQIRRMWMKWPPKQEAIKNAYIDIRKSKFSGRVCKHYMCNHCQDILPLRNGKKQVLFVDHITPVVDVNLSWQGYDTYLTRLLVSSDKLQVLCDKCHKHKTLNENSRRRK